MYPETVTPDDERIYCIYQHTSPSGKSYIGQTKDYGARCKQHEKNCHNRYLKRAIHKHGWDNFTHKILARNLTLDEANGLEELCIVEKGTLFPGGYNLLPGGTNYFLTDSLLLLRMQKKHKAMNKMVQSEYRQLKKRYPAIVRRWKFFGHCYKTKLEHAYQEALLQARQFHFQREVMKRIGEKRKAIPKSKLAEVKRPFLFSCRTNINKIQTLRKQLKKGNEFDSNPIWMRKWRSEKVSFYLN